MQRHAVLRPRRGDRLRHGHEAPSRPRSKDDLTSSPIQPRPSSRSTSPTASTYLHTDLLDPRLHRHRRHHAVCEQID
ncbi:MAG: hypothetical protein MZV64_23910 [Ignavibacteriales bacterium]|nr:hypothetical protein [Ignavibacteriales bacterium]